MALKMFGAPVSCLTRANYLLGRTNLNTSVKKSHDSGVFLSNLLPCSSRKFVQRVSKRWFKLCCCLAGKHSRDENKLATEYSGSRIIVRNVSLLISSPRKVGGNSISVKVNETRQPRMLPGSVALGIEVFPENFDKLPPKCTGCGAILQSQNENEPGFIPENRNPSLSNDLDNLFKSETICMRCFSLKHYNKDVPPMVAPDTIVKFLTHIARRKALILYVVDVMDIPSSFADDILKIVGETKHIILVCNKIDRLPVDGRPVQQIQRISRLILNEAMKFGLRNANIRGVSIISARTGFGVHGLVQAINKNWRENSDVYLVGCNNSGKTLLFNLLVDLFASSRQSDNMLQRGTVSSSPGTTLSLLRYPITSHRFLRLQDRLKSGYSEAKSRENQKEVDLDDEIIDRQMTKYHDSKETPKESSTNVTPYRVQFVTRHKSHDQNDLSWLYDTPGLYNKNQITHLLTNHELRLLNPSLWLVPRTVILKPGKVVFLGSLARLDYLNVKRMSMTDPENEDTVLKASQSVFFTIFASPNLPVHVTTLERADSFYDGHAGGELLKIPIGGKTRMEEFPGLRGSDFEITGLNWKQSAADVVLSNVGWIAVTSGSGSIVKLKAHTPGGVGLYLREPALLPTSVRQRGRRGVPYLGHVNHYIYQGTRKKSPPLTKYFPEDNTTQWMKVAERKRKEQRALLNFEKTKHHAKLKLGFSARSNPSRYLPDFDCEEGQLESDVEERQKIGARIAQGEAE